VAVAAVAAVVWARRVVRRLRGALLHRAVLEGSSVVSGDPEALAALLLCRPPPAVLVVALPMGVSGPRVLGP